jgi:hypothetical protein
MTLYKLFVKYIFILIFGVTLLQSCNGQNKIKKPIDEDCNKFNDSAMSFVSKQNFIAAVDMINLAVNCDPENNVFIRNKGMILANAGFYKECIYFIDENKKHFTKIEVLSTSAECYYNLNDTTMFDSLKTEALIEIETLFNKTKNESNLIAYLTVLKQFDGKNKALQVLNSNKDLFTTSDMYIHMLEFLDKIPTLKMEKSNE